MPKTSNVFARVEPEVKEQAERVLNELGLPISNAVAIFLRQVVLQRGLPFEVKLPRDTPLAYGGLSEEQFNAEMEKGMADLRNGRVYSAADVREEMRRVYGV